MKQLRTCGYSHLNTGVSKCPPDFEKMTGAIIVPAGIKLPVNLTAETLEEMAHADVNERIYGTPRFVEYAKNGGEPQTSQNGYGPEEFNGFSARKDTFTLVRFYPELHASITRCANQAWGAYFYDKDNILYGIDDGTDVLAPFPMSCIYSDATPHPTSSAKATMSLTFAYEDSKEAAVDFDYRKLDFNVSRLTLGLLGVKLEKVSSDGNAYKLYEAMGGYDLTPVYGSLLVAAGADAVIGSTSAITYDAADKILTIVSSGSGGAVRLNTPANLFDKGIKGIEQV